MAPKLYKMDLSQPVMAVYITAKALDITLEYVEVNLVAKDQLSSEFLKLNPQHTVPTLQDDGKIIWDSHAINIYLVSKYGKNDSLYPNNPYKRAVIDQRLHFDSGVLYALIRQIVYSLLYKGVKTYPEDIIDEVNKEYDFLNKFLEGHKWVAGDDLTLADFSLLTTTTSMDVLVPIHATKYPNVIAWVKRAEQLPYYNVVQKGLHDFRTRIQEIIALCKV